MVYTYKVPGELKVFVKIVLLCIRSSREVGDTILVLVSPIDSRHCLVWDTRPIRLSCTAYYTWLSQLHIFR